MNRYDLLNQQIKELNTQEIDFTQLTDQVQVEEKEKAMVYLWIRLYLKEETRDTKNGDQITIQWQNEKVPTTFIGFNKKGLVQDHDGIVNADLEEDLTGLILMIDERLIKDPLKSLNQPFIRTLFKESPYFEYQVYRREELTFVNTRTGESYEYIEASF